MIYYVALPFTPAEAGGLAPGQAVECPNGSAAMPPRASDSRRQDERWSRGILAEGRSQHRRVRGRRCAESVRRSARRIRAGVNAHRTWSIARAS